MREFICMNIPIQMLKTVRSLPLSLPHSIPNFHVPTSHSLALPRLLACTPSPSRDPSSPSPSFFRPSFFFCSSDFLFASLHLSVHLSLFVPLSILRLTHPEEQCAIQLRFHDNNKQREREREGMADQRAKDKTMSGLYIVFMISQPHQDSDFSYRVEQLNETEDGEIFAYLMLAASDC